MEERVSEGEMRRDKMRTAARCKRQRSHNKEEREHAAARNTKLAIGGKNNREHNVAKVSLNTSRPVPTVVTV
jgi:hypothetical protein